MALELEERVQVPALEVLGMLLARSCGGYAHKQPARRLAVRYMLSCGIRIRLLG
ncbi:hypothetical protein JFN88_03965 [Paenibacillus sp. MAHUQ-46]|uniref:Uncharacterized protein n=1 Tax=Paenibacillus roseus TaxID=2798579 RepID=A0A934IZD2_9BACL|nr:hypothetical protein [Paenibacillus roseus]MBJ6360479.1 hypothetical protein [Paenibacillus roseus]